MWHTVNTSLTDAVLPISHRGSSSGIDNPIVFHGLVSMAGNSHVSPLGIAAFHLVKYLRSIATYERGPIQLILDCRDIE